MATPMDDSDTPPLPNTWFTAGELAERWRVSKATVMRESRRGRIKKSMIGGGVRFSQEEVARYEREA